METVYLNQWSVTATTTVATTVTKFLSCSVVRYSAFNSTRDNNSELKSKNKNNIIIIKKKSARSDL